MSVFALPVRNDAPHFDFFTNLDGERYGFEFKWNEREERWYMSVLDSSGTDLLSGRKVVVGLSLIGRFSSSALPPGRIMAVDTQGTDTAPGLNDLGQRVQVLYFDESEG